ncbi:TlpA family protein disulfide reductase [Belliella pelovolcani]|uniref:TlpA family protein disulfide reductase n=1 Tax=Belliella pelovolcani TaxID=529505 RepID=UPI00391B4E62
MRKILIIFTILAFACQKKNQNVEEILIENSKDFFEGVTIISSDANQTLILKRSQTFESTLKGVSAIDTIKNNDTIVLHLEEQYELFSISPVERLDNKDFLLESGDTLFIVWENEEFHFSRKKEVRFRLAEWSYDLIIPNNLESMKIDSLKSIFVKTQEMGGRKFILPNIEKKNIWEESLPNYVLLTNTFYSKVIDSLEKKIDAKSQLYAILAKKKKFNDLDQVFAIVKNDKFKQDLYDEYLTVESFQNRYLSSVYGQYYFRNYSRQKNINLQDVYDDSFQDFDPTIIRYFKSRTIQEMVGKKYNRDVILSYLDKYKAEYGELSPLEELAQEMEFQAIEIDDMALQSMNGETILWEELKNHWKGKVIYLDFWASWCAPCLRAMPYSKSLNRKLSDEEVVFIYLSINDKEKPWLEKSHLFEIAENNYLIKNSKTSEFIKANKINTIPRYLIFDREGNLVHLDAPGPEKDESFEVLMQILKK